MLPSTRLSFPWVRAQRPKIESRDLDGRTIALETESYASECLKDYGANSVGRAMIRFCGCWVRITLSLKLELVISLWCG